LNELSEGKIIINALILISIVPTTLNLMKNYHFNKKFKEEFRKAFNMEQTNQQSESAESVWQEIQNLIKSFSSFSESVKRKKSSARKLSEKRNQRKESIILKTLPLARSQDL
jgi:hypothetical protein